MRYLIAILLLTSCANVPYPGRFIHPDLKPWVDRFESTYGITIKHTVDIEMLELGVAGVCRRNDTNGRRNVFIDKGYHRIFKYNFATMHNLVYHELGHCTLRQHHDTAKLDNGEPKSIMYPEIFGASKFYLQNLEYYEEELRRRVWGE